MNHLRLFEEFEAPVKKMQMSSNNEECPYCDSTNVKISKWVKDRTGRVCRDCGRVWDINYINKN